MVGGVTRVLLDTSALLYWTLRPEALPERARRAIADAAGDEVVVSAISLWEIGLKVQRGTLDLGVPFEAYVERVRRVDRLTLAPVDVRVWLRVLELPWEHRDPADRVIVATAEVLDVPVVTSDEAMRRYTDRAIWT